MDLATIIGIVGGLTLVLVSMSMGSPLIIFVNVPGMIVVFGGTIMCTLVMQKLSAIKGLMGSIKMAFFDKAQPIGEMLPVITHLAAKARKEGLIALEGENINDVFMARGVRLGVDGLSPDVIRSTLLAELASVKERHDRSQKLLRFMAGTAPSMGMIGTLIGLVQMLQALDDPAAIGPGMAVALLTTLYGAVLAFMIFAPLGQKLESRTAEEVFAKQLAIVGVDSILRGDNTMIIQSKLEAYLSPKQRAPKE
jgi:chemotaxis protein MotA